MRADARSIVWASGEVASVIAQGDTLYTHMARALVAEGVERHFTLMGDANMHLVTALAIGEGVRTIHARHEHCAVAMACGYARASGKVGFASTTCGPGFTQIATALTTAVRGDIPLVVFAGDTPVGNAWNYMDFDQRALTLTCGAEFIGVRSLDSALDQLRAAFYIAAHERRPVVIGVPHDLQMQHMVARDYAPSATLIANLAPALPDPDAVAAIAAQIAAAHRAVILAGRGAVHAVEELVALGEAAGALLSHTMYAQGLFTGRDYDIGLTGGWCAPVTRELLLESDLVLAFGTSLSTHTRDGGKMFPNATVVQIDTAPRGLRQGDRIADIHLIADARAAAVALTQALSGTRAGYRTDVTRARIADAAPDDFSYPIEPGAVDPRAAVAELNDVIPEDWYLVLGSGHSAYFTTTGMTGRPHGYFQATRDFGAIGSNLATAIGAAEARGNDGKLILIDGDGSLLMHIQELETIARQGIRMLIVSLNDGAYGAEVHKLRKDGIDASEAEFGRPDFAAIGAGFGLRGRTFTQLGEFTAAFKDHIAADRAEIWDVHIASNVVSAYVRARK